jgi:tRNA dimethylallyltransferase
VHVSLSRKVVAVVGPTAAGKSDLAVELATRLRGEVVNTDSMQLYHGMDIGTAKLTESERRGVRHHLLDILDIKQTATVAEFQQHAVAAIADCHERGVIPVLVGGSALYVRAVLDGFEFPGTDPAIRRRLEEELATVGASALHRRLAETDPVAAEQVLPTHAYAYDDVRQIGLDVPRDVLDRRIEQRVQLMWDAGFVDEVRRLEIAGIRHGLTASRALGYAQILDFLSGDRTEQEAKDATITATRRFARRQDSWFRKDPRIHWLPYDAPDLPERALALAQ